MTVADFILMLRRSWIFFFFAVLIGLASGAAYSATQTPVYTASSSGFMQGSAESGVVAQEKTDRIQAYLALITSNAVVERIAENPDLEVAPEKVRGSLSADLVAQSAMITVTARAESSEGAAALANGALEALADVIREIEQEASGNEVALVTVTPFENAVAPASPSSPNWMRNMLMGAAAGFALGLAYQLLRRILDIKVRSADDLTESAGGLGLLALIPRMGKPKKNEQGLPELDRLGAEAFRHLRTNLRFSSVDSEVRSIVVTSANQGEGKTTVVVALARMLAESGVRTLIIDADLRRPAVANALNIDGSVGLSSLLSGQITLNDALRATNQKNLFVLPSGVTPPNPSELVGSAHMKSTVERLSKELFVIIDAPPVLPVTDAALASTIVDGVIFVARSGKTTKPEVRSAHKLLEGARARMLGVVLNGVTKNDGGDGYYYYSKKNRGYYLQESEAANAAPETPLVFEDAPQQGAPQAGPTPADDAAAAEAQSGRRGRRSTE
ncbi:capsular exopolysaccharide synthesis family protein [Leucobacter exalbidus]|uniref:non-specific protein-tyrosine kinase n=1 Tax=Leucobacter exalbidus TaxID=662960 RepID=A0A940PY11_9MICO|nr:polysaccharide biosynthesis tyrosine autokinase [Leucobacter exalbidus]MBP1326231.1 capsular exopolysaccharide synthesis family protein [Leucobacter exalbidus]